MSKIKVKVREYTTIEKEIEIEVPYYYKHKIFLNDYTHHIYGVIDGENETTIQEKIYNSIGKGTLYEIEKEKWSKDSSYMKEEQKSSKEEFDKVKQRFESFYSCI